VGFVWGKQLWRKRGFVAVLKMMGFLSTSPAVGISIYPPSPLPLEKEGGIFTKGIVLIVSFM
jgi:hypothetical protein